MTPGKPKLLEKPALLSSAGGGPLEDCMKIVGVVFWFQFDQFGSVVDVEMKLHEPNGRCGPDDEGKSEY